MNRSVSEFALIAKYFAPLAQDPAALSLSDDACLLDQEVGRQTVMTADMLVEGVHFFASDPPDLIAQKALRVNLSDLAAKAAAPRGYLLALSLPAWIDDAWLAGFARGLAADQKEFAVTLLGGDTTATPGPLTIAITAIGTLPQGRMIRRGGARAGDKVFVSGTIGDSGAGLQVLQSKSALGEGDAFLVGRYHRPIPRVALGQALTGVASAALDVSDGLIADLGHIAETSQLRLVIAADRIPLSPALRRIWPGKEGIIRAATCGDDYEIAFTAASEAAVAAVSAQCGVPVTLIGHVEAGAGVTLVDASGKALVVPRPGYVHF